MERSEEFREIFRKQNQSIVPNWPREELEMKVKDNNQFANKYLTIGSITKKKLCMYIHKFIINIADIKDE